MAITIQKLIEFYEGGVLDIEYDNNNEVYRPEANTVMPLLATVGGTQQINVEQGINLCSNIGWTELNCHPFRIIDKTRKFVKGIKNHIPSESMQATTFIEFQNRKGPSPGWEQYGKTTDRILIGNNRHDRGFSIVVVYGLGSGGWSNYSAKYEIFDGRSHNKIKNCGSLKQVAEYIMSLE